MRGHDRQDEQLEEFIAARTQDLHHDAYQFTAGQRRAEDMVVGVLAMMRRERIEMAQAGATARLRMAETAARDDTPAEDSDVSQLAAQFRPLALLSPRQRTALTLQVLDDYDERETARALHLSTRAVTEALRAVPYDELPGASPHSGELRSLLEDFGDLATPPSASTTLADVRAAPPPPRRPWWTYVAALLVVGLTVGSLVVTQRWHDDWLRTPEGLNHAHGTRFPAYTQGYELVGIQDIAPGPARTLHLRAHDAVVISCTREQADQSTVARVSSGLSGDFMLSCSKAAGRQHLTPATGDTVLAVDDFSRKQWPVAVYRKISWSEYPVVQRGFVVEKDKTIAEFRPTDNAGHRVPPLSPGKVLTLHGPAHHPNGTFTATLPMPEILDNTIPVFSALLSPTTTGQFQLVVGDQSPVTNCGSPDQVFYAGRQDYKVCSLTDREVPQIEYSTWGPLGAGRTVTVRFTVRHALGPWTLQLVDDVYRTNHNDDIISP